MVTCANSMGEHQTHGRKFFTFTSWKIFMEYAAIIWYFGGILGDGVFVGLLSLMIIGMIYYSAYHK